MVPKARSRPRDGPKKTTPASWRSLRSPHARSSRPRRCEMIEIAVGRQQLRQPLAGVEHAGLHRVLRHSGDPGDLLDRLVVKIHEVDDLAMLARHLREAASQLHAAV